MGTSRLEERGLGYNFKSFFKLKSIIYISFRAEKRFQVETHCEVYTVLANFFLSTCPFWIIIEEFMYSFFLRVRLCSLLEIENPGL